MEEGYSEVLESEDSSRRGIWGHKQAQRLSTQSDMVKQPICHADEGPVGLCEQAFGTTGTAGQQTGQRGDYRSRGSKCTAGWTTSVTPCLRFPWRQD